jgi:hypothetical protein
MEESKPKYPNVSRPLVRHLYQAGARLEDQNTEQENKTKATPRLSSLIPLTSISLPPSLSCAGRHTMFYSTFIQQNVLRRAGPSHLL